MAGNMVTSTGALLVNGTDCAMRRSGASNHSPRIRPSARLVPGLDGYLNYTAGFYLPLG